jgi:hypothetical protein
VSIGAIIFMGVSWTLVLGLCGWAFSTLLRDKQHFDPDGLGPAAPPREGEAER